MLWSIRMQIRRFLRTPSLAASLLGPSQTSVAHVGQRPRRPLTSGAEALRSTASIAEARGASRGREGRRPALLWRAHQHPAAVVMLHHALAPRHARALVRHSLLRHALLRHSRRVNGCAAHGQQATGTAASQVARGQARGGSTDPPLRATRQQARSCRVQTCSLFAVVVALLDLAPTTSRSW